LGLRRFFKRLGNGFISFILRSPLHVMFSKSILLITVTGRKTGKKYTTPVNYLHRGDELTIISLHTRTWWRNLRGGREVTIWLCGRKVTGKGQVIEDERGVAAALTEYLQRAPNYAKYFDVALDAHGQPVSADVERQARSRVVIQVELPES
jgi:deazaflavin-dependent oxidoreductase (nitroreductase family)